MNIKLKLEGYLKGDFTVGNCLVKSNRRVIVAIDAMLVIVTGKRHVEMVVAMNACYVIVTTIVTAATPLLLFCVRRSMVSICLVKPMPFALCQLCPGIAFGYQSSQNCCK